MQIKSLRQFYNHFNLNKIGIWESVFGGDPEIVAFRSFMQKLTPRSGEEHLTKADLKDLIAIFPPNSTSFVFQAISNSLSDEYPALIKVAAYLKKFNCYSQRNFSLLNKNNNFLLTTIQEIERYNALSKASLELLLRIDDLFALKRCIELMRENEIFSHANLLDVLDCKYIANLSQFLLSLNKLLHAKKENLTVKWWHVILLAHKKASSIYYCNEDLLIKLNQIDLLNPVAFSKLCFMNSEVMKVIHDIPREIFTENIFDQLMNVDEFKTIKVLLDLNLTLARRASPISIKRICESRCRHEVYLFLEAKGVATVIKSEQIDVLLTLNPDQMKMAHVLLLAHDSHIAGQENFESIIKHVKESQFHSAAKSTPNTTKLKINQENKYLIAQSIIEEYYLQPFPSTVTPTRMVSRPKHPLKDGVIEREVHGAMHAARVGALVLVFHRLLSNISPEYTNVSLQKVVEFFHCDAHDLLALVQLCGVAHDSARENDNQDRWDDGSGKNCKRIFVSHGIEDGAADYFGKIIELKDDPKKFAAYLQSINIKAEDIIYFDYFRALVALSDCLDILRCVADFNFSRLFALLPVGVNFDKDKHESTFISLTQALRHLLRQQKDMVFDYDVPYYKHRFNKLNSCYQLKTKVKYEHAENVMLLIVSEMKQDPFLNPYLLDEIISADVTYATIQPAFNPFIHGTNSLVFLLFSQTNDALWPVKKMLHHFSLAPLGGEIQARGANTYDGKEICFGRLNVYPEGDSTYNLSKVVSSYSENTVNSSVKKDENTLIAGIEKSIAKCEGYKYQGLLAVALYIARARQLGLSRDKLQALITKLNLIEKVSAVKQSLYFILFFGKYIQVDQGKENQQELMSLYSQVIRFFKFEYLNEKLIETNLDIQTLYEKYNDKAFHVVLKFLLGNHYEQYHHLFTPRSLSQKTINPTLSESNKCDDLLNELSVSSFFWEEIYHQRDNFYFDMAEYQIMRWAKELDQHLSLFVTLLHQIDLPKQHSFFMNHRFPIVLVSNQDEMPICNFSTYEYRVSKPQYLGKDIKMIATDTNEHRLIIMKYLEQHQIKGVDVILIVDLYLHSHTAKLPVSPYTHNGGFPRLSWLAAKTVIQQDTESTANHLEVDKLLNNAKKYRSIAL